MFADVPFAIVAGPGIENAVMLSDVEAAVTSQAGVWNSGFAVCQKQGCREGGQAPPRHVGSRMSVANVSNS